MKIEKLEQIALVHVDFDIWSGQTSLKKKDLNIDPVEMKMDKVIQLGTKKICDPKALKGFAALKTEARRALLRFGITLLNGYAVPLSRINDVLIKLEDIEVRFNQLRDDFLNEYDYAIEQWVQDNKECEAQIRDGILPIEQVKKRINFDYQVYKIGELEDPKQTERLKNKIEGAGDDLVADIANAAENFFEVNLSGKKQCDIKTRKTLENLKEKVDGLVFLDGKLTHISALLQETLLVYANNKGRFLEGSDFDKLVATVLTLSSQRTIEQYCSGAAESQNDQSDQSKDINHVKNKNEVNEDSLLATWFSSENDEKNNLLNNQISPLDVDGDGFY